MIECYVDADIGGDESVAWTMDIAVSPSGWTLTGSVLANTALSQDEVGEFAAASGTTQEQLISHLHLASGALDRLVDEWLASNGGSVAGDQS